MRYLTILITLLAVFINPALAGEGLINQHDGPLTFHLEAETGIVGVLGHSYQSGRSEEGASTFDFVNEGGQDILFRFDRYVAGLTIKDKHKISLLYQPLEINTNVTFKENVMIDSVLFTKGTPMDIKYGFPFYRFTYAYSFLKNEKMELAGGFALQARNASIVFKESNGVQMTVSQNVGPVPALNVYGRYNFDNGLYLSVDATGLYASSAIINGASFSFEGSILDASLRAGYPIRKGMDLFANLRFLGGTAKGESEYVDRTWSESGQAYTENILSTTSFTLGLTLY